MVEYSVAGAGGSRAEFRFRSVGACIIEEAK